MELVCILFFRQAARKFAALAFLLFVWLFPTAILPCAQGHIPPALPFWAGALSDAALASDKKPAEKRPLHVYTWPGVLPQWLLDDFTAETGIPLEVSFYTTSEHLIASLLQASKAQFDVILPMEHLMPFLIEADMVMPLERSRLPGLNALLPRFARKPNEKVYSLPLYWGVFGLVVDTRYVKPESIRSWNDLWNDKITVPLLIPADLRPCINAALFSLGYSPNTKNVDELRKAWEKTAELAARASVFSSHDVCDFFQTGQVHMALSINTAWASGLWGDSCAPPRPGSPVEASPFAFVVPQGRSVAWALSAAIPRSTDNPNGALLFLQYLANPERAARLSAFNGLATANAAALDYLPKEVSANPVHYPTAKTMENMEAEKKLSEEIFLQLEAAWSRLLRERRMTGPQKGNVVQ